MKEVIVKETIDLLVSSGFQVSECTAVRSCFDILARRDETLLLIKVLVNIEAANGKLAMELRSVASAMSAVPLIIGDHMKTQKLSSEVIYTRHGVHVVNVKAFENILNQQMPSIYTIRGNYCVRIDPGLLAKVRKKAALNQEELAAQLGISKQSVHRYESEGRMSLEVAERLTEFLKKEIYVSREIFLSEIDEIEREITESMTELKRIAYTGYTNMGFEASITNAPFDIIAKEKMNEERILTIASNDRKGLERKVEIINQISEITGSLRVCISDRARDLDIQIIKPNELSQIKDKKEFIDLIDDE